MFFFGNIQAWTLPQFGSSAFLSATNRSNDVVPVFSDGSNSTWMMQIAMFLWFATNLAK